MKRVNFKDLNLSLNEVLSRQDMKKIRGGYGYDGTTCTFQINCLINGGTQPGGTCTGPYDPQFGCAPTEEQCYNDANAWCATTPGCGGCVPY